MDLDSVFRKLIENQVKYQSDNLGLNLLISRLQRKYSTNRTEAELDNCLQEMKAYLSKYNTIMQPDIEKLKKLQGGL